MSKIITFLCVDPMGLFCHTGAVPGRKMQYEKLLQTIRSWPYEVDSYRCFGAYGEIQKRSLKSVKDLKNDYIFQYVETQKSDEIERIFQDSELVIISLSGFLSEFEKTFFQVFPWKEKILFLWCGFFQSQGDFWRKLAMQYQIAENRIFPMADMRTPKREDVFYQKVVHAIYQLTGSENYGRKNVCRRVAARADRLLYQN